MNRIQHKSRVVIIQHGNDNTQIAAHALKRIVLDNTGFLVSSSALGVFPQTHTGKSGGQVQPWHQEAILRFTKRSSRE